MKKSYLTAIIVTIIVAVIAIVSAPPSQTKVAGASANNINSEPTVTVSPTEIPTDIPTVIPTEFPTVLPTLIPSPTHDPAIQDRINQIDQQVSNLHNVIQNLIDAEGKASGCGSIQCTMIDDSISNQITSYNFQIQQLEAEKTQLEIQQN